MSGADREHVRVKATGEVFTPIGLVQNTLDLIKTEVTAESAVTADLISKTFLDPTCGDGQFLTEVLIRKLESLSKEEITDKEFEQALQTIYGVDLMPDNVRLCQDRLLCGQEHLRHIVERNIVCADALRYHYRFDGSHPYDDEVKAKETEDRFNSFFPFE